ncbi:uncharacterized protein BO87DRAFT_405846 [Aspergillus neoniger CBS 115656]|uniref:Uncharacterized protein n=1 Tax=Aspergillus neoniger (strain CBS 115656) TaxID=1448310 RepID=A0A318ZGV2_ASPNB|nr:hypothetical protein BO87DRAFT_405846 [Aspergillus neoniger CBS 115656]PYH35282.1 hypothetical protein BO87DRAFT_405846 [Aspergillus neoniger CBS 115656]
MIYLQQNVSLFDILSTELPKPPVPYTTGWRFTAESYNVSIPMLVTRGCCTSSESDKLERNKGNDAVSLEILKLLKKGDGYNSQVFTNGAELVVKIYNLLYFNNNKDYLNLFLCMDKYYTHEANIYKALANFQGHESWNILIRSALNNFLGYYISPLLCWKDAKAKLYAFSDWIDWDWDCWLEVEFVYTVPSITPQMRERWSDE